MHDDLQFFMSLLILAPKFSQTASVIYRGYPRTSSVLSETSDKVQKGEPIKQPACKSLPKFLLLLVIVGTQNSTLSLVYQD